MEQSKIIDTLETYQCPIKWLHASTCLHVKCLENYRSFEAFHAPMIRASESPSLLQNAANATLRPEFLREIVCDAIIANGGVWKPSKMYKTFAMTDASNTVQILVACVMRGIWFSSINCLWWGGTKETGSQMKVCAIYNIRFTRMNCLWLANTK